MLARIKNILHKFIKLNREFFFNYTKLNDDLYVNIKPNLITCYIIVAITVGFFIIWGGLAPIDSAVIAQGSVVVSSERQIIQHLEGGVIEEIYVGDGQVVKKGDPLILINSTSSKSSLHILEHQLIIETIAESRLLAELSNKDVFDIDPKINALASEDEYINKALVTQRNLFDTNRSYYNTKIKLMTDRITQTQEKINSLQQIKSTIDEQISLLKSDINNLEQLLKKNLVEKSRVSEFKRHYSELQGRKGEIESRILEAGDIITQTNTNLSNLQLEYQKNLTHELTEVQQKIKDINEKLVATRDIVERSVIKAPVDGIVNSLKFNTIGGVITHGAKIMEIVPQNEELVIEGKLKVSDISYVHIDQKARVLLTAYKTRYINKINAIVTFVSADRYIDETNGSPYYKIKVKINKDDLKQNYKVLELYPGMPAQIFVVTGSKTLLQYLFEPLYVGFQKSLREE